MMDVDYSKILKAANTEIKQAELPTYEQRRFAENISQCLQIDLPKEYTKEAYTKYISTYHAEYYEYCYDSWECLGYLE